MRLRTGAVLAASAALLVAAAGCEMRVGGGDNSPIVIGADLELTGAYAAIGTTYERALELKVDTVNAQGGVDGRQLRLEVRDNRSDPSVSVSNITYFTTNTQVAAIIMGGCSQCAINASKIIESKKIPTVTLAPATQVVVPAQAHQYLFKVGPNLKDSAAALVDELKSVSARKVGLLTTDDVDGQDASGAIIDSVLKAGASVKSQAVFRITDTDLSQPVGTVLDGNVDTLVVSAFPSQADAAVKAARDNGFKGRVLFTSMAAGDLFVSGATGAALDGTIMVAPTTLVIDDIVATTPANATRKTWFANYVSKYGGFSQYSTYAADAVQLLIDAMQTTNGTGAAAMRNVMEDTSFDGMSGPIRTTPDNHSGLMPQSLTALVANGGRWRLLG